MSCATSSPACPFRVHKPRLRIWLTPRAYTVLAVIIVCFAFASAFPVLTIIAQGISLAFVLGLILDAILGPRRDRLKLERAPLPHFALRTPTPITYELWNRSPVAVRVAVGEASTRTLHIDSQASLASLAPRSRATLQAVATPHERGRDQLGDLYARIENQIGLLRRDLRTPAPCEIRVYPDLRAVERYRSLRLRVRSLDEGARRLRQRGQGSEFESLREYIPGDAFRDVDWHASARRGKLIAVQREAERGQSIVVLLDCGRMMTARLDDQRKFDYALGAALSFVTVARLMNDHVGVIAFAQESLLEIPPRSALRAQKNLADALVDLEPQFVEADYARAIARLRKMVVKRSLVLLFTDAIDPVAQSELLADLGTLARHHLVMVAFFNDAALENTLALPSVKRADDAFVLSAALALKRERNVAFMHLRRLGIHVLDLPAQRLGVGVIDEYLAVRNRR